jgi:Luciferase-like monooxygenase
VGSSDIVETGRRALGRVGVFLPNNPGMAQPSADGQRDAARRLEQAGYQAVWNNEGVGGRDGLIQLGILLAATERMTFGTAIANIWARPPQTMHAAAAMLADAIRIVWYSASGSATRSRPPRSGGTTAAR